jgi:hypothetical protein
MDVYMNATPSDLRLCQRIWKRMLPLNANSLSERKGDLRSRKIARFGLVISLFIALNISLLKDDSVAVDKTNHYRQWALIQLNNLDEFHCLDELYFKESRWNPKAKNGSHYGIPQGRSMYLSKVNGFKQVEWGLKYIANRHQTPCLALDHFKRKGWH